MELSILDQKYIFIENLAKNHIPFVTILGGWNHALKRQSDLRASCTYFIQNFARNSMVAFFLRKNLRFTDGGHFEMSPPYNFFPALDFFWQHSILFFHITLFFSSSTLFYFDSTWFFLPSTLLYFDSTWFFFSQHLIIFLQHLIFF